MDEFTEFERAEWDKKAPLFASTWGTVTAQSVHFLLQVNTTGKGVRVLDIGCGTGDFAGAIEATGASVVAVDASSAMCAIARSRYPNVRVLVAEAESLPCDDGEFDLTCMNYLILHVSDQERVLREAARTVKLRGQVCWTNWVPPVESEGMGIIFSALGEVADFSVLPPAPDIFQFSDPKTSGELFSSLGFGAVQRIVAPTEWRVESGNAFFDSIQAGTRIGGLIEKQETKIKVELRRRIAASVERFRKGAHCVVPMPTHIFTCERRK